MHLFVTCFLIIGPAIMLVVGLVSVVQDLVSRGIFAAPSSPNEVHTCDSASFSEHRSDHQRRNQDAHPEETRLLEVRGRLDGLVTQCFAVPTRKDWPNRRGHGERQE